MNDMLFSEAQEYCTEKLPQLEADLVEPQMLRLTSAAQETFLNEYFHRMDAEKRGTSWFIHLGLQYRPEDELWHWAANGVYEPAKSGPPVGEGYALEKAKHTFDEYNIGRYGNPFKPNYPMCLCTPSWILQVVDKWIAVKCEESKFRLICESKPKKVEVPDNGVDDDEIREKLESLSTKMEAMGKELESLRLPLGFIYVQLPGEKEPNELWPSDFSHYQWTDVSESYDSLFFRVAGKRAAPFGSVQEQQQIGLMSKFIDGIKRERCQLNSDRSDCIESDKKKYGLGNKDKCSNSARVSFSVNLTLSVGGDGGESGDAVCSNDGWSAPVWTAFNYVSLSNDSYYDDVKSYADYHQYHLSSGGGSENAEIRPRNMAVKVWKRTA